MVEDVVCSRRLGRRDNSWSAEYHGRRYRFCSLACKAHFELEPEEYLPARTALVLALPLGLGPYA